MRSFILYFLNDSNSIITVNRTSSPKQDAIVGILGDGSTIYYSDEIKITFSAKAGYGIDIHKVNDSDFASGSTHTVTSNVIIEAAAKAMGLVYIDNGVEFEAYEVYIDNGNGWDRCIPYIDNGTSWDIYG